MMLPFESAARLRSSKPPVELNVIEFKRTPPGENFSRVRFENQLFSARITLPLGSTTMDRIGEVGIVIKLVVLPSDDTLVSSKLLATSRLPLGSVATASTALVSEIGRDQSPPPLL